MNIAIIDFDDIKNPLLGAGQAHATFSVGKELIKLGHTLTVYCNKYPGYKDRVEHGIKYIHIGANTPWIRVNNLLFPFFVPFTVSRINSKEIDILIECFTAPQSTLFSPIFTKIPVVVLPSMFNAHEFSKKYHFPFHIIEKFGAKFYKYILPYSEIDATKIKKYNPNIEYKIVPQGVGKEYFSIKPKSPKHILFLSRLDMHQKGIDLLLKAYAKIKHKIKLPLVIAGHGPDENKVTDLITSLNLTDQVTMVGSAYGDKKFKLMSEAYFTVFPSRHDEMCLWTLESIAAGLPLVAFDLPESKWLPGSVALKASAFSIEEYSEKILEASNNKKLKKMKIEARNFAKNFSWENTARQYLDFFNMVLERNN